MTENTHQKLAAFAKSAGLSIHACDPSWGGSVAYTLADEPNTAYCGFRSERAAYRHWLEGTFGAHTAKAVLALLRKSK